MLNLSPKERVMARRLLRLMRTKSEADLLVTIEELAKSMGLSLDPAKLDAEQRDELRAGNRRPGRTKGLRRSFAG